MIDIKLIRDNFKEVMKNVERRGKPEVVRHLEEVAKKDKEFLKIKPKVDELRHQRNKISEEINQAKRNKQPMEKLIKEAREIPKKLAELEKEEARLESEIKGHLMYVPNLMDKSVPDGKDANDNPVRRSWGKIPKFDFPLKSHVELAESLGIADFEAGRENAGQGFNYLLKDLAMLDHALQRYGVDFILKKGFSLVVPPMMLNKETLSGAVDLSAFEEVIYKVEGENLYLIGTAEHPLVSMLKAKTVNEKDLPFKFCAATPCFRKEIGGHGVDTKGVFRMHQFNKVEQVVYTSPEESAKALEEMQKITEEFFQSLKIPYRVVEICSGDLGAKFAKQYDIEAWFPRQQAYKEITSAGSCIDYQARRLNIKYFTRHGERRFVHILNNTMVATSRAMVAIIENYQQKDGSVRVPDVLIPYMHGKKVIGAQEKKKKEKEPRKIKKKGKK